MPDLTPEQIEAAARSAYEAETVGATEEGWLVGGRIAWPDTTEGVRARWRDDVRAAFAAVLPDALAAAVERERERIAGEIANVLDSGTGVVRVADVLAVVSEDDS